MYHIRQENSGKTLCGHFTDMNGLNGVSLSAYFYRLNNRQLGFIAPVCPVCESLISPLELLANTEL